MTKINLLIGGLGLLLALTLGQNCLALGANFDPNYIISDEEVLNYTTMTQAEIQTLLESKGSYLANYMCQDNNGVALRASEAIYSVANTNRVNPRFLLVLLQKEQGLVEDPAPKASSLDWATGYGCPDGGGCNERWRGFYKQINSASLQFRDYIENPNLYKYQPSQTYTFSNTDKDPMVVTPANKATAGLYNYTPHVYNGNYNFWKLWNRYFVSGGYPDGSLLQAQGDKGVWLVQNGQKRPFTSWGALISRFDPKKILQVKSADLNSFTQGAPIKFPQYAIVRAPDKKLYLLVDNKRRLFANDAAFKKIGYNPEEIVDATEEEINAYQDGKTLTINDAYPLGALLKDKKTGGVYWVSEDTKAPLIDPIFLKTKFKNKKPITVTAEYLAKYKTVAPIKFDSGELVKFDGGFTIYVVENSSLRPIASANDFESLGYKWANILTINPKILELYNVGESLKATVTS
jgi:hypothetical protein